MLECFYSWFVIYEPSPCLFGDMIHLASQKGAVAAFIAFTQRQKMTTFDELQFTNKRALEHYYVQTYGGIVKDYRIKIPAAGIPYDQWFHEIENGGWKMEVGCAGAFSNQNKKLQSHNDHYNRCQITSLHHGFRMDK